MSFALAGGLQHLRPCTQRVEARGRWGAGWAQRELKERKRGNTDVLDKHRYMWGGCMCVYVICTCTDKSSWMVGGGLGSMETGS